MRIVLLCKLGGYADAIQGYLEGRGNKVFPTGLPLNAHELSGYDIGVSWFYRHILHQPELDAVKLGIVNCHPAMLPYCRGAMPNVWSLAYGEPAGVSMHYMSPKVDQGNIIAQRQVEKEWTDTGETLYHKLLVEQYALFMDTWPTIEILGNAGIVVPTLPQQSPYEGSQPRTYKVKDTAEIDDLDRRFGNMGRTMINILRARTFPPHEAAYFTVEGQKYYVRVSIEKAPDGK